MSIVAIVSGIYCGGDEIAAKVAERLDFTLVGEELLEAAAERYPTTVEKLARALAGSRSLFDGLTREQDKSLIYLKGAVAELLGKQDVVYHGPATHLIVPEITHVLRVGLVAEQEYRVQRAVAKEGIDAKEAERRIAKSQKALAAWTDRVRGAAPWDPSLFDLKIPTGTTGIEGSVDLICEAMTRDALRPTDRSIGAAMDFRLASCVGLTLLERGYPECDVTATGGNVSVVVRKKPSGWGQLGRALAAMRLEELQDEVKQVAREIEGVMLVSVRPGAWYNPAARTLLVDDEVEYVMTLSERLGMRDIPSDTVYDGEQALAAVEEEAPDVMVLDLRMPGIDGIEVLRRVRKDHPEIQVIVITGHGSEKDERLVRELGAFEYLEKPVAINVLAETIQRARAAHQGEAAE